MHRPLQNESEPDYVTVFSHFATRLTIALEAFLFPPACLLCGESQNFVESRVCGDCSDSLGYVEANGCPRCGCPGELNVAKCYNCGGKAFIFRRVVVGFSFEEGVQRLLRDLKYRNRTAVVKTLAGGLIRRLRGIGIEQRGPREIVPILLHSSRQRERGYNQSELIARELSRSGFGRLSTNLVVRIRATSSQTALDTQERLENVEGAFSVKGSVEDKHIWLVDDVVTTGATVNACAEALLVAGASSGDVMAVACPYGED